MNKLQEIFDQLKDAFMVRWDQFQDTDTYMSLKDRYDNMSPRGQKITLFALCFTVFLMIFSIPQSWFTASQENVGSYEYSKSTIQDLLEVSQESKSIPPQSTAISGPELRGNIERIISERFIGKDQVSNMTETPFSNPQGSSLIPSNVNANGIELGLKKLNLKQIIDLGYDFGRISPLVKTLSLDMTASIDDPHYYDVIFRIASFSVNEPADPSKGARKNR